LGIPPTDLITIDTAQYQEALKRYWAFMSTKNKAWGVFKLSVSKPIAAKAKNHETPKAFFNWCVSHYSPKNEVILQRLFDQFQKMSLNKASSMEDYLSKLELTQERITVIGSEFSDSQLKAKTINSLSAKFNTFKTTYNIVGKFADTFKTLNRLLLNKKYNLGQLKDIKTVNNVQTNQSNDEKKKDDPNNKQRKERVRCDICRLLHTKTKYLVKTRKIPAD
jgi:gag-polypeptide of LTR copia-type